LNFTSSKPTIDSYNGGCQLRVHLQITNKTSPTTHGRLYFVLGLSLNLGGVFFGVVSYNPPRQCSLKHIDFVGIDESENKKELGCGSSTNTPHPKSYFSKSTALMQLSVR
jgi:hypothetical protein